jgi:NhaP-type Na+/H+ or K+/H+ antiporter
MQTKKSSLKEAVTNVAIGYTISFISNAFIFPLYGFEITLNQNLEIGAFYTVISIIRSYVIRRFFNKKH